MNTHNTPKTGLISFLCLLGLAAAGLLYAAEETATERAMQKLSEFKAESFVNVRGERRGYLAKAGVLKQNIKLFDQQEYLTVVAGDDDITGLNLSIRDDKGVAVAEAKGEGTSVTLKYTPPKKDKYEFVIEVPGQGGYYHFTIVTK